MKTSFCVCAVSMIAIAAASPAAVLWDQSNIDISAQIGFVNSVSPGFNGGVAFGVSDVSVPAGGWTVQSVSTYFSALTWFDGDVTQAVLSVFPKSGSLPASGSDPRSSPIGAGTTVAVSMIAGDIAGNGVWEIKASGLSIALTPGEYWIGLTPVGPTGGFGPDIQWASGTLHGDGQALRLFGPDSGWLDHSGLFGVPATDGAIKIEGVPTPAGVALLGMSGLFISRRRR